MRYGVLLVFGLGCLIPLFWVLTSSLKTTREIALNPLGLPLSWRWANYPQAWVQGHFGDYFLNSVIVTLPIVIGTCVLSALAGYGFARFKFPGASLLFYLFLLGLMIPFQSIMIPLFYILKNVNFLGTYWAMIVPSIALGLSFGIFFMRAFFVGLPQELADAAMLDGCNEFQVFRRVLLPLAGPALSTLAVLNFMGAWNSFLLPLIYMQKEALRPLVLGLMFFSEPLHPRLSAHHGRRHHHHAADHHYLSLLPAAVCAGVDVGGVEVRRVAGGKGRVNLVDNLGSI